MCMYMQLPGFHLYEGAIKSQLRGTTSTVETDATAWSSKWKKKGDSACGNTKEALQLIFGTKFLLNLSAKLTRSPLHGFRQPKAPSAFYSDRFHSEVWRICWDDTLWSDHQPLKSLATWWTTHLRWAHKTYPGSYLMQQSGRKCCTKVHNGYHSEWLGMPSQYCFN